MTELPSARDGMTPTQRREWQEQLRRHATEVLGASVPRPTEYRTKQAAMVSARRTAEVCGGQPACEMVGHERWIAIVKMGAVLREKMGRTATGRGAVVRRLELRESAEYLRQFPHVPSWGKKRQKK